jgi:hypothetical protein
VMYSFTDMDPYFRSWNSFFLSLITLWGTWCAWKAALNSG